MSQLLRVETSEYLKQKLKNFTFHISFIDLEIQNLYCQTQPWNEEVKKPLWKVKEMGFHEGAPIILYDESDFLFTNGSFVSILDLMHKYA
jgi:hypothetical protein